jgi:hypothetical protein
LAILVGDDTGYLIVDDFRDIIVAYLPFNDLDRIGGNRVCGSKRTET